MEDDEVGRVRRLDHPPLVSPNHEVERAVAVEVDHGRPGEVAVEGDEEFFSFKRVIAGVPK